MEHLTQISTYNNNYFQMPFRRAGCNIVYQHSIDDSHESVCQLGTLINGSFVGDELFFLFEGDESNLINKFAISDLSPNNIWL